jgi:transketolase
LTLAEIAKSDSRVIALDAEVSNSTFSEYLKKKTPKQFIECFIAEQNMLGIALGLSKKGYHPYVSTFSAFLTRAHDQIRMASISGASFTIAGSHCGVSIGEDGASQMGLDDISMFRAIPNSTIFYPSDAVSTQKLLQLTKDLPGVKYLRTTRGKTPLLYSDNELFEIGEFKTIKSTKDDRVVLVGAGITLHECLKASEDLRQKKISASVIDCYCVKPFNSQKFIEYVKSHGNRIVIAEDHFREGGIGEMIASAISNTDIKLVHLAVDMIPHSGKPEELLEKYRIDSKSIVSEVLNLVKSDPEVQTSQSPQKKPKKK